MAAVLTGLRCFVSLRRRPGRASGSTAHQFMNSFMHYRFRVISLIFALSLGCGDLRSVAADLSTNSQQTNSVLTDGSNDAAPLDEWSAPYRNWHYWPEHVIPSNPQIGSITNLVGTDVPTVYQIPGSDKWYLSFVGFDGQGYESFVAESDDLVRWGNYRLAMGYGSTNQFDHGGGGIGGLFFESDDIKGPRGGKGG